MRQQCVFICVMIATCFVSNPARAADDGDRAADEKLLQDAKQAITGDGLCEFFRTRTPSEANLKRVGELIRQLGSEDFETRDKASVALAALGKPILPVLRKEANHPDLETRSRIRDCIEKLETTPNADWAAAAARLMRDRKPKDAVAVLLTYLPYADDSFVENEVMLTLLQLGVKDNKVDERLAAVVKDPLACRRAAAALALARSGNDKQKTQAEQALKDSDAAVRFRAAQGFIAARNKNALPVLLALLTDASQDTADQAEDLLSRLAADDSPPASLGSETEARKKCRAAWETWWKKNGETLDLSKRDVDVTAASPSKVARDATRKFVDAISKHDTAVLEKLLDEKVNLFGLHEMSRAELIKLFKDAGPKDKFTIGALQTVKIDEILKTADPALKPFLEKFAREKVQCVRIEIVEDKRTEKIIIVLRMKGGKPLIAGLGPEK